MINVRPTPAANPSPQVGGESALLCGLCVSHVFAAFFPLPLVERAGVGVAQPRQSGLSMTSERTVFARNPRRTKTVPERQLWRELKVLNEIGFHFRQQVSIGRFYADFAELSARLIIEVDGDSHSSGPAQENDVARTEWLNAEGFRVLRFDNRQVLQSLPGVVAEIQLALNGRVFPLN